MGPPCIPPSRLLTTRTASQLARLPSEAGSEEEEAMADAMCGVWHVAYRWT